MPRRASPETGKCSGDGRSGGAVSAHTIAAAQSSCHATRASGPSTARGHRDCDQTDREGGEEADITRLPPPHEISIKTRSNSESGARQRVRYVSRRRANPVNNLRQFSVLAHTDGGGNGGDRRRAALPSKERQHRLRRQNSSRTFSLKLTLLQGKAADGPDKSC
jgi:hypothetical protein